MGHVLARVLVQVQWIRFSLLIRRSTLFNRHQTFCQRKVILIASVPFIFYVYSTLHRTLAAIQGNLKSPQHIVKHLKLTFVHHVECYEKKGFYIFTKNLLIT